MLASFSPANDCSNMRSLKTACWQRSRRYDAGWTLPSVFHPFMPNFEIASLLTVRSSLNRSASPMSRSCRRSLYRHVIIGGRPKNMARPLSCQYTEAYMRRRDSCRKRGSGSCPLSQCMPAAYTAAGPLINRSFQWIVTESTHKLYHQASSMSHGNYHHKNCL